MNVAQKIIRTLKVLGVKRSFFFGLAWMKRSNPIRFWDEEEAFQTHWNEIRSRTLLDKKRCYQIFQFCQQTAHLEGDIAELGVYRGGTAKLILGTSPQKTLHLFDTFSGIPRPADVDFVEEGDFSDTSLKGVQEYLKGARDVRFYQGIFPDTATDIKDRRFSFVHMDGDTHQAAKASCEFFYPRLVKGGVILFDDFGSVICEGVKEAVDEFIQDKPERPIYLPTGQGLIIRT